ncbi:hypothetical protein PPYR_04230 [Photinus pyralis]|uniref:LRRCT domain-containing protein n=2 Tax=Photinus pyralis TaxID=7054 RepID=A0A1Y1L7W8_PHOPY|nr:trophoblast glycoprotein isoform X2 [Photinus pyralis]KAB0802044.1 hypothetical protein PPYR_04230 [Photinus pyralis]
MSSNQERRLLQTVFIACVGLSFINLSHSTGCKSPLLEKCICGKANYDRHVQYVVNCTGTGFTNTEMLADLPEETQVLIFTGNHIPELPWNVFGEMKDLSVLKTIDMSNNDIREIKGKSYHHVTNVERLILNHNNLTISSRGDENFHHPRVFSNFVNLIELHLTNAFADNTDEALAIDLHDIFVNSNLTKLYKIHLEQNEIKRFRDQYVFCDLPSLLDIYLGNNYIPSLNFNITCIDKLRFLDLENNNMTYLSQTDLDNLNRMTYPARNHSLVIDIGGNPFRCDSAIKDLYVWMHTTNVTVRNKELVQCREERLGNKFIYNLNSLVDSKHARVSRAVSVLVVVLSIILLSLFGAYVYIIKDKLHTKLTPLLDIVSRKVHYTTIESQDV